jgi:glutathione synthase
MPPTTVSANWEAALSFGRTYSRTVLKPLNEAQSKGVSLVTWDTPEAIEHARGCFGELTGGFRRPVVVQKFIPAVAEGEVRLWFVDGSLIASVKKAPTGGDFRIDTAHGFTVASYALRDDEAAVASQIGSALRSSGIRLAAVDLIACHLTDFNFTSPGLLVECEAALHRNLAQEVVRRLFAPLSTVA